MNSPLLHRIDRIALLVGALAALCAAAAWSVRAGASVALGAAVGTANFYMIRSFAWRAFFRGAGRAEPGWVVALAGKFLLVAALLWFVVTRVGVTPIALAAGFTSVLAVVMGVLLAESRRGEPVAGEHCEAPGAGSTP